MKSNKKVWVWVGAAVVVLVVSIAALSFWGKAPAPAAPAAAPVSYAPKGQLISGFPPELVLDSTAKVVYSDTDSYSPGKPAYTAQWTSTKSMSSLFATYQNYFKTNGWTISNVMTAYAGSKGFHAENATAAVSFSVVDKGASRDINVTYAIK